ncbi:MAG: tRNA preQ1(34) S-adenosylmethionine ribosyltransferase-isomerase QueA [Gammaproteobacteria bacterium]|nr:MAG: tRNA preQ1(34) S-adenosylmethionine ribosyltransferase-isomerase QueA [Gammaproteobacteria bacterium]
MRRSQFDYDLPQDLIAQQPLPGRGDSRLLLVSGSSGQIEDSVFQRLPEVLDAGDLLVLNDTRVIPARLFGRKPTGGRVEILVERPESERVALAQLRASKTPRSDTTILIDGGGEVRVLGRQDDLFRLSFDDDLMATLDRCGHVPLPPYIARDDAQADRERYQTVYADRPGAVAAPTAGLHFDESMLARLSGNGIEMARVTLHVGAGTFQPVRTDDVRDHPMHSEWLQVTENTCEKVAAARARGCRVVAVGTTVVRSLETAAASGKLTPFEGLSNLFIYPGYDFCVVDAIVTNFHLPESSLLMLVCAFAGTETVLEAYRHAIRQRYRFFSYGDAMFVTRAQQVSRQ